MPILCNLMIVTAKSSDMQKTPWYCLLFFIVLLSHCKDDPGLAELNGRWDVNRYKVFFWEWSYEYIIGTYILVDEEVIELNQGEEYFEFYNDGTWQLFKLTDGNYVSERNGVWDTEEQTIDGYLVKKITSSSLQLLYSFNQSKDSYQEIYIYCKR